MTDLTTRIQRVFDLADASDFNLVNPTFSADIIRELCGLLGEAYYAMDRYGVGGLMCAGIISGGDKDELVRVAEQIECNVEKPMAELKAALSKLEPLKALWGDATAEIARQNLHAASVSRNEARELGIGCRRTTNKGIMARPGVDPANPGTGRIGD